MRKLLSVWASYTACKVQSKKIDTLSKVVHDARNDNRLACKGIDTMNVKDLRPASHFARQFGVKVILYGEPGIGKTPCLNTAPSPLLLATEPGLLSMKGSNLPTFAAYSAEKIAEFFDWFFNSAESKRFDTLAIDSGSQLAEIVLADQLPKFKDGRKAYGEMSQICMRYFDGLFFTENKNIVVICKKTKVEFGKTMVKNASGGFSVEIEYQQQPYFPGQDLNVKVPHRYDEIIYMARAKIPQVGETVAFHCRGSSAYLARDRSGNLNEFEPPNLTDLFKKIQA